MQKEQFNNSMNRLRSWIVLGVIILLLVDGITTWYGLKYTSLEEQNSLLVLVIENYGLEWMIIMKTTLGILCMLLLEGVSRIAYVDYIEDPVKWLASLVVTPLVAILFLFYLYVAWNNLTLLM